MTSYRLVAGFMYVLSDASEISNSVAYAFEMAAVSDSLEILGVWSPFAQVRVGVFLTERFASRQSTVA